MRGEIFDPVAERRTGHWPRDAVALGDIAAELEQDQTVFRCFDTFGDDVALEGTGQSDHAFDDGEVIRVIDGPLALAPCVSRLSFRKCEDCPDLATCALREALLRARDATSGVLEGYSLADAANSGGAEVFGGL